MNRCATFSNRITAHKQRRPADTRIGVNYANLRHRPHILHELQRRLQTRAMISPARRNHPIYPTCHIKRLTNLFSNTIMRGCYFKIRNILIFVRCFLKPTCCMPVRVCAGGRITLKVHFPDGGVSAPIFHCSDLRVYKCSFPTDGTQALLGPFAGRSYDSAQDPNGP